MMEGLLFLPISYETAILNKSVESCVFKPHSFVKIVGSNSSRIVL